MPLIESKKTGLQHYVTFDDWLKIKSQGWGRRYKVLDDTDLQPEKEDTPEITDFSAIPHEMYLEDLTKRTITELKQTLAERGIEYQENQKKQYYIDLLNYGN